MSAKSTKPWSKKRKERDNQFNERLAKLIKDETGVFVDHSRSSYAFMGGKACWIMYGQRVPSDPPGARGKRSWVCLLYGFTSKEDVVKAGKLYFPDEGTGLKSSLMLEVLPYPKEATVVVQANERSSRKKAEVPGDRAGSLSRRRPRQASAA